MAVLGRRRPRRSDLLQSPELVSAGMYARRPRDLPKILVF
jgi:hypothetical protein